MAPRVFIPVKPIIPTLLALLFTVAAAMADRVSDEILAAFQTKLERSEPIDELCDSLEELEPPTLRDLNADLDKAWPGMRDRYIAALESAVKKGVGLDRNERSRRIRELREQFMAVYRLDEGPMKPLLKSQSMPAVEELRKLISPTPEEISAQLPAEVVVLRKGAMALAQFRDAALDAALSSTPSDSRKQLAEAEQRVALDAGELPRDGLRILEKNREIAEDDDVPADEARGIEEANMWRMLVGLNALELDPKLCDASRDHSKDMAEKGFFAHESPVPGKRTPWDRAKNFDTTASGENIYAGGSDPSGANRGWFFSPGHHKNMFSPGQRRIGLGHHAGRWTQMFGK